MARWLYILVPVALGAAAFEVMKPANWADVRQGLVFTLSLLGAAVLVRLARGMPVSNTDYFEVDEVRGLSAAVKKVYRALIALLSAIVVSIVGLVFVEVVLKAIDSLTAVGPGTKQDLQQAVTAGLVVLVSYALGRTISLVRGDYDLVQLQAKLMERAVERRHAARRTQEMDEAAADKPFQQREGYGKLRQ